MDLRKEKQSPLRYNYHNNDYQQQMNPRSQERQFLRTSTSPYGPSSLFQQKPTVAFPDIRRSQNIPAKSIEFDDYSNQQANFNPNSSTLEAKMRIDERHEELKRQIAMKEKLLAEMQSERESTRRLRQVAGSTINQQSLQSFMVEESNRRGTSNENIYSQLRKSPVKQVGMIGLRSTHLASDSISKDTSPQQATYASKFGNRHQQLQFYPPLNKPVNTYQDKSSSPLRNNLSKQNSKSGSRSRSKSNNGVNTETYQFNDPNFINQANQRIDQTVRRSQIESPTRYQINSQINQQRLPITSPFKDNLMSSQQIINGQISQNIIPSQIQLISLEARDKLYRDRIETMTMDNTSLQRRLKHVQEDLDRLRQEKDELSKQMRNYVTDNDKMHRAVNQKDELDMENQTLQQELEKSRDINRKLEFQLQQEQIQTNKAGQILDHTNFDNKNLVFESSSMTVDLQKKLRMIEDISRDHAEVLTKINFSNIDIDNLNKEDIYLNHDNIDLATKLAKLQHERQEINKKIQQLQFEFDDLVRETNRDRRILNDRSRWQNTLITTKVFEKNLEKMLKSRVQKSFKELNEYSNFDKNCHKKLKAFSKVANKLGLYKQKIALYQWYVKVLKPLSFKHQNKDISMMIEANRIQQRVFYAWKNILKSKIDSYHLKSISIEKIWYLLGKGLKKEMKRAISIWKEKSRYENYKFKKFIILLRKLTKKVLLKNFSKWQYQNLNLELAVRAQIIQNECTERFLLSQCFSQLKIVTQNQKRCRMRTLNHILKGWREHIKKNRHLMQANMASIKFVQVNKDFVLQNCFDSLKLNKEVKKQRLIQKAVEEEMQPAILKLEEFNYDKSTKILSKSQLRAGLIVRDMFGKKLDSFFKKWFNETQHFRIILTKNINDRLIKLAKQKLWGAFSFWKNNALKRIIKVGSNQTIEKQNENESLCKQALEKEKFLRTKEEEIRFNKRRLIDKLVRKFIFRKQYIAIRQWLHICNKKLNQEQQFKKVAIQMKKRLFKDAFDNYISFLRWSRQHDKNISKSLYFLNKLHRKEKQKIYNVILFFSNRQIKARRYWNKILNKMDKFLKLRTISLWKQNAGFKLQDELLQNQKELTDLISDRNQRISSLENQKVDQNDNIQKSENLRRKKAHRQIANYFIRTYTFQSDKYFKLWKEINQGARHKQGLLKKSINQWRMISFQTSKQAFKKFVIYQRQKEAIENIKRKNIDQVAIETNIINDKEKNDNNTELKLKEIQVIQQQKARLNIIVQKSMMILERRNHDWIFVSRQRMIFQCWRHAVKQQKAFLICVKNVLQKSMYMKGFHYIKNSHSDIKYSDRVFRYMKKFILKSQRKNCNDAFNKWKKFSLSQVDKRINNVSEEMNEKNNLFNENIKQIKRINTARVYNFIIEKNKKNLFDALLNVVKHKKLMRNKTYDFLQRQKKLRQVLSIKLWSLRNKKTQFQTTREQILKKKIKKRYLRACLNTLKKQLKITKNLVYSLGQFEKFMRNKIYSDSLYTIKTYKQTKAISITQDKYVSSHDFIRLFRQFYFKKIRQYFQQWKGGKNTKVQTIGRFKMFICKRANLRLRTVFDKWRKRDQKNNLLQEMYFEGPARCEEWETSREISNLKDFMRQQRYSEDEIENQLEKVNERNNNLMRKYIIRMQYKISRDKKYLPYCWERLKAFVAIRKLIRYQFRFCHNQTNNVKADLQRAFNKWNRGYESLKKELSRIDTETLVDLAVRSTAQVGKCSEQLAENQAISNHLMIQRDEFLNFYIKSQMLAFALIKDRSRFAQMQAWSRWFNKLHQKKMLKYQRELRDETYLLANLKTNEKELTEKNKELISENKELGEFSKDSQKVKQNMLQLKKQRDAVLSQLQETDDDFNELQKENEKLKEALQKAEEARSQSKNRKFLSNLQIKVSNQENKKPNNQSETTEEKKKREQQERFERLQAIQAGSSIR